MANYIGVAQAPARPRPMPVRARQKEGKVGFPMGRVLPFNKLSRVAVSWEWVETG
jgi:hypothetical protein